ncbi:MAG TPA: DUF2207 domain-containing protein [Vicinamibacterales bacterium]|nr:DUF2207 domain-containing protein [Vicinamibacterales bacterium]
MSFTNLRLAVGRFVILALAIVALVVPVTGTDEGWIIERLTSRYDIQPDGTLVVSEAIDVDFRGLSRHGIFRDVAHRQDFDGKHNREYDIRLSGVTAADGRRHQVKELDEGGLRRFRIGDPDKEISGKETYRIDYSIGGALNAFADHDELYWNATGPWPVRIAAASIVVRAPGGSIDRADCFQGPAGSRQKCAARFTPDEAVFTATRPLEEEEQLTIVVSLRKGAVAEPRPVILRKPREVNEFFELTPLAGGLSLFGLLLAIGGVGGLWWEIGRDRRSVALHAQPSDTQEEREPLFGARPIGVEFEPPEQIRPGQTGLLIDETADTLDVTATIVDLAVRGYLSIRELPKEGWFGSKDWQLDRLKPADTNLVQYERIVLAGLFDTGSPRKLSELKNKFYDDLAKAKKSLYEDAVSRRWFPRHPESVRTMWRVLGLIALAGGVFLTFVLGRNFGAGLIGLPVIVGGALLTIVSRAMPRRTALGREMMRRTLGFAKYIRTAETQQQAFAERANIFTAYLPYAIAFRCVDQWARAFQDIDMQAATASWYMGSSTFNPSSFSSSVESFSSSVSTVMTSTPGGSGGSGFSGGSSGGGGGGGGGGSW